MEATTIFAKKTSARADFRPTATPSDFGFSRRDKARPAGRGWQTLELGGTCRASTVNVGAASPVSSAMLKIESG